MANLNGIGGYPSCFSGAFSYNKTGEVATESRKHSGPEGFDISNEKRNRKRYVIAGLRARVRAKTLFGLSSKPTAKEYPGLDISEGGIQFAITKDGLKLQDEILLDISIPSGRNKPLCVKARVIWVKLSGDSNFGLAGLQFVSLNEDLQAALNMLIKKHGSDKEQTTPYLLSKMQKNDSLLPRFRKQ